jgi:hypothetical protein
MLYAKSNLALGSKRERDIDEWRAVLQHEQQRLRLPQLLC